MRSVTNFTSFLTNLRVTPAPGPFNAFDPVDQRVLLSLQNSSGILLSEVAKATALSPEVLLPSIERLTASNRVEVVHYEDNGPRFLRLTSDGYAALKLMTV